MNEFVARMREAAAAIRRLHRLGGHTAATTNALTRHQQAYDTALRSLTESGETGKRLAGEVAAESSLIMNIDQRKANHTDYYELTARLYGIRRSIRQLTAEKELKRGNHEIRT